MEKAIKIFVAVMLLTTAFSMPEDYYRLVSFVVFVAFSILAYNSHVNKKLVEVITYLVLILIIQPFYVFDISKKTYIIINIIIGVGLLLSVFIKPNSPKKKDIK
ncbi:DUF6804 family protein [Myroides sp. LJL119]